MHTKKIGAHRSTVRSTSRGHGSHRRTTASRFRLDWIWGGLFAWAVAFWAATTRRATLRRGLGKSTRHEGTLYRVAHVLRTAKFWDSVTTGLPADRWAPVVAVVLPSWNQPTRTSIEATPWGRS